MNSLDPFAKKSYLNLETFRKNGVGVKTPVWFVQDGDLLYVRTEAKSGKAKRIRNNGKINTVPCAMNGKPQGTWMTAQARDVRDPDINAKVDQLMKKKYGFMYWLLMSRGKKQPGTYTVIEVKLTE